METSLPSTAIVQERNPQEVIRPLSSCASGTSSEKGESSAVRFLSNRWHRSFGTCSFGDGTFFGMTDPVGDFFFCRNRHPLMRDDVFLLHVRCSPPLSPAMACIEEVPSSASCIGRPSSALHVCPFRLKSNRRKRNGIDVDGFFLSRQKCRTGEIRAF